MTKKVLIVEDQFVEANDLQLMLSKAGYVVCGIARSVAVAQEMIAKERPDFVLVDIFLKGKQTGIDLAKQLQQQRIAFIFLSANSNEEILMEAKTTQPYGFIVKPFRERDLIVNLEIAQYLHEHSIESKYRREAEIKNALEKLIPDQKNLKETLLQKAILLQREIPFDYMTISCANDTARHSCGFLRIGFSEYQTIGPEEMINIAGIDLNKTSFIHSTFEDSHSGIFNDTALEKMNTHPVIDIATNIFGMHSLLVFSLNSLNGQVIEYCFFSRRENAFENEHLNFLKRMSDVLKSFTDRLLPQEAKIAFSENYNFAPHAPQSPNVEGFEGIVGTSHLLLNVFDNIKQVAPFDTSVLILGESGTGKEKIADCIHALSPRKGKTLVKVNCAALPPSLIESELFGHEKGSFTGATERRTGKFEMASGGTIFLDEIGEMPPDMQVKLLRVLQEKEIEKIGARQPVKVNVRIIAATNRNLEKEVAEGRFRLDLYYRLNIFPVQLPSLRERKEDIPLLAAHFLRIYNVKSGKNVGGFSDKAMEKLLTYHWPGNIRELENLVERSVLLARSNTIDDIGLPVSPNAESIAGTADSRVKTIYEIEREHIMTVLKKANGKIWGAGGAAELLNVPPTTLTSKMKKLGIKKRFNDF